MANNLKKLLKKLKLNESSISTFLGAVVIIIIGGLIFNYFRGVRTTQKEAEEIKTKAPAVEGQVIPEGLPTTHQVSKGESLWEIAEKYYGSGYNWVDIANENKLAHPGLLFSEQTLIIPEVPVRKPLAMTGEPTALPSENKFGAPITESQYQVVKGDHLWGIAVRAYGDGYRWTQIAKANKLANPGLIHPGNILTIPR